MPRYSTLISVVWQFLTNGDYLHQAIETSAETCQITQRHAKSALFQSSRSSLRILSLPAEIRENLICFVKGKIWAENNMRLPKNVNVFHPKRKTATGIAALAPVLPMFLQFCHFVAKEWRGHSAS